MKKQVHPAVIVVVVLVAAIGLGYYFVQTMQPASYVPSPGAGGRPAASAPSYGNNPSESGTEGKKSPVVPPQGSRAGDPHSLKP